MCSVLSIRKTQVMEDTTAFSTLGWFYFERFEGDRQVGETLEDWKSAGQTERLVDKRF